MIKKILINKFGRKFYIKDTNKDLHTQFGFIKSGDLKKKDGSKLLSNTKEEFTIFTPYFIDIYKKIKRSAQIISLKDIGHIVAETGINNKSKVVDAGSGSGALACFLANISKEVTTYDIRDDFIKVVEENKKLLNLKNLKIKNKNIYEGIDEKDIDLIVLDLPEPWKAIDSANNALKIGGFLVSYSPSISQTVDFVNAIIQNKNFVHIKTIEIIEREWEVNQRIVRPKTTQVVHTGFLSFVRRI